MRREWRHFDRKVRIWYPWKERRSGKTQGPRWGWWGRPRGPPWPSCGSPGFVLASVSSLSFPHLCRSALVFPPVSRCSHGLACPPPGPHPEPGSAFSLSHTAHGCMCIRRTPNRRRFHFWSPASARKCKSKQHFPYFSFCALGSESRSQLSQTVWDEGQMRVSDGAPAMMTAQVLFCFFFLTFLTFLSVLLNLLLLKGSALFYPEELVTENPLISKLLHFPSLLFFPQATFTFFSSSYPHHAPITHECHLSMSLHCQQGQRSAI